MSYTPEWDKEQRVRRKLVALGGSMGVQRYVGQHKTEAAHEFADAALKVIEEVRALDRRAAIETERKKLGNSWERHGDYDG